MTWQEILSYLFGGMLIGYTVSWFVILWRTRPAVVQHPLTGQWTAARSVIVSQRPRRTVTYALPSTQALPPTKE